MSLSGNREHPPVTRFVQQSHVQRILPRATDVLALHLALRCRPRALHALTAWLRRLDFVLRLDMGRRPDVYRTEKLRAGLAEGVVRHRTREHPYLCNFGRGRGTDAWHDPRLVGEPDFQRIGYSASLSDRAPKMVWGIAVSLVWKVLLDPTFGVINWALGSVGLPQPNWLGAPFTAMPSLIMVET